MWNFLLTLIDNVVKTGPAGSIGWIGNRSQHRSGRPSRTVKSQNRTKMTENRSKPFRTVRTGEPVAVS
jgi:hypothetical protein